MNRATLAAVKSRIYLTFFALVVFSGCVAKGNKNPGLFPNSGGTKGAGVVVFTTDNPANLIRIKRSVSTLLFGRGDRGLQYDDALESIWNITAYRELNSKQNIESAMKALATETQQMVLDDMASSQYPSQAARRLARSNYALAKELMARSYTAIDNYASVLFWTALALKKDKATFPKVASLYVSTVTPNQIASLEQGFGVPVQEIARIYRAGQKGNKIQLSSTSNCRMFLNGRPTAPGFHSVPLAADLVLTADCSDDGIWSQVVQTNKQKNLYRVTVSPQKALKFQQMPNPKYLTSRIIQAKGKKRYTKVLYAHFSAKKNQFNFSGYSIGHGQKRGTFTFSGPKRNSKNLFFKELNRFALRFSRASHSEFQTLAH